MRRRYWLPIFAVVGLILAGQVHAQAVGEDSTSKPSTAQSQTKPKADTPPALPIAVQDAIKRIPIALEAANKKQPSQTDEDRAKRNLNAQEQMAAWVPWMFGLGGFEILLTSAGVFLVWRTLKASWAAAREAKRAADAARDTVNSMEDASKRQLRAYVGVERLAFDCENFAAYAPPYTPIDLNEPGVGIPDFLCVTVKNFGQTPAFETIVYAYWLSVERGTRPPPGTFDKPPAEKPDLHAGVRVSVSRCFLQRDQNHRSHVGIADLGPMLAAQRELMDLYIFGRIYYRDAFGRPWRTKFAFEWQPDKTGDFEFVPYEEYNGEDQQPFPN